nr:hypothetical protein [uncultured Mucilaginibacter sp.]
MIVRSINAYRHVKSLCRFFGTTRNTYEVIDGETIAVLSGKFSGLIIEFEPGLCNVSGNNCNTCFDVAGDFSAEALLRMLAKHCIISDEDFLG